MGNFVWSHDLYQNNSKATIFKVNDLNFVTGKAFYRFSFAKLTQFILRSNRYSKDFVTKKR